MMKLTITLVLEICKEDDGMTLSYISKKSHFGTFWNPKTSHFDTVKSHNIYKCI